MKPTCPRLRFDVQRLSGEHIKAVRIEARTIDQDKHGRQGLLAGTITVAKRTDASGIGPQLVGVPYTSHIEVTWEMQRCGIGTKLYGEAAKIACKEFGEPLHSDIERSVQAEGFWQKQVTKGRAVCTKEILASAGDWEGPIVGRNGCETYKLSCPAPRSLGRTRRPR